LIGGSVGLRVLGAIPGLAHVSDAGDFVNVLGPGLQALDGERFAAVCRSSGLGAWAFLTCFPIPLLAAGVLYWRSTVLLGRESHAAARLEAPLIWRIVRPSFNHFYRSPTLAGNPLVERARRFPVYDRRGVFYALQSACVVAVASAWLVGNWAVDYFAFPACFLVNLIFPAVCVIGDRQNGLLAAVAATPLSAKEVAEGTMAAINRHLLPRPVVIIAASAMLFEKTPLTGPPLWYIAALLVAAPAYSFSRLAYYISLKEGIVAPTPALAVGRALMKLFWYGLLTLIFTSVFMFILPPLGYFCLVAIPLQRANELRPMIVYEYEVLLNRQPARDVAGLRRSLRPI
jgi:hypothetical protein